MAAAPEYPSPSVVAAIGSSSPSVVSDYYSFGADWKKSSSFCSDGPPHQQHQVGNDGPLGPTQACPFPVMTSLERQPSYKSVIPTSEVTSPMQAFSPSEVQSSPRLEGFSASPPQNGYSLSHQVPPHMHVSHSITRLPHDNEMSPLCVSDSLPVSVLSPSEVKTQDASGSLKNASCPAQPQNNPRPTMDSPSPRRLSALRTGDAMAATFSGLRNERLAVASGVEAASLSPDSPKEGGIIHRLSFSSDIQSTQSPPLLRAAQFSRASSSRPKSAARSFPSSAGCSPPFSTQGSVAAGAAASPTEKFSCSFPEHQPPSAAADATFPAETRAARAAATTTEFTTFQRPPSTAVSPTLSSRAAASSAAAAARQALAAIAAAACDPLSPPVTTASAAAKSGSYGAASSATCSPALAAAAAPLNFSAAPGSSHFPGCAAAPGPPSPSSLLLSNAAAVAASPSTVLSPAAAAAAASRHHGESEQLVSSLVPSHHNGAAEAELKDPLRYSGAAPVGDASEEILERVLRGERRFPPSTSPLRRADAPATSAAATRKELLLSSVGFTAVQAADADATAASAFFNSCTESLPPSKSLRYAGLIQGNSFGATAAAAASARCTAAAGGASTGEGKAAVSGMHPGEDLVRSFSSALSSPLPFPYSSTAAPPTPNSRDKRSFFFSDRAAAAEEHEQQRSYVWQRWGEGGLPSRLFFEDSCCSSSSGATRTGEAAATPCIGRDSSSSAADECSSLHRSRCQATTLADKPSFIHEVMSDGEVRGRRRSADALRTGNALGLCENSFPRDLATSASPTNTRISGAFSAGVYQQQQQQEGNPFFSATPDQPERSLYLQNANIPPGRHSGLLPSTSLAASLPLSRSPAAAPPPPPSSVAAAGAAEIRPLGQRNNGGRRSSNTSVPQQQQQQLQEQQQLQQPRMQQQQREMAGAREDGEGETVEIVGGVRQNAAMLPVFETNEEMITHGSRYGGDQPTALRPRRRGGAPAAGRKGDVNSRKVLTHGPDEEEEEVENFYGGSNQREPRSTADWKAACQQVAGENRTLRRRMQEAEFQIFALQQNLSKETARAAAQAKQQTSLDAALRAARSELLQLRHTLRLHLRGIDLPAGAVVGGAADVRREAVLMRQALQEAADYNAELLEQNESLRVRISELECGLLPSSEKDVSRALDDGKVEDELRCWRSIFEQLQAACKLSIGDATPANMKILLEELHKKEYEPLRCHKTLGHVFASTQQGFTTAPAAASGAMHLRATRSTWDVIPAPDENCHSVAKSPAPAYADDVASAAVAVPARSAAGGSFPRKCEEKHNKTHDPPAYACKSRKKDYTPSVKKKDIQNSEVF